MFDLYDELRRVVAALEVKGVEYALCGGLAMAVHAVPRATEDIDILIQPDSLTKALAVARELGFEFEAKRMRFGGGNTEIQRITKIGDGDVLMLDFLLVTPQNQQAWETRERISWHDGNLWVVSRAGLILLKTLSGRRKDVLDIDALGESEDEFG